MINESSPFKGLNMRIPIIIPINGRGFIHSGSTLGCRGSGCKAVGLNLWGLGILRLRAREFVWQDR